ncbi:hypothetical protein [Clostridium sp.]|uniref:hypothetical protein n=1 Tax=Clostridium sp. TaxID=1506 RepID=UPI00284E1148|nr:hypothetical protein [Clostridium sp.]MDR3595619.1 hypothetical protein [Clostridium sp.]
MSKGTTDPEEINKMMVATKELIIKVLGSRAIPNYFIMDELNPDGCGVMVFQ